MATRFDTFRAIVNNPTDDKLRLKHAEQLGNLGLTDRAELIRTAVAINRYRDPDTGRLMDTFRDRWEGLVEREAELQSVVIASLGPEIAGAISNYPGIITFDNGGLIHDLNLSNTQVTELPEKLEVAGSLNLTRVRASELPHDLQVGENFILSDFLSKDAKRNVADMPGLSITAKCSALNSIGLRALADQVARVEAARNEGRV
jgi:uncharacterized protein (TIGR02996 family)